MRDMFSDIAAKYDLANTVLSCGVHHWWRSAALRMLELKAQPLLIDVCCGTGDLGFEAQRRLKNKGQVFSLDFSLPMLELAAKKNATRTQSRKDISDNIYYLQADALALPFPENCADCVMIAFGIRNVDSPARFLLEAKRVLLPGGSLLVLEFGQPTLAVFRSVFSAYTKYFMPFLGGLLTGNRAAYRYLPETSSKFPAGAVFEKMMTEAGYQNLRSRAFLSGIAYAYLGKKPNY